MVNLDRVNLNFNLPAVVDPKLVAFIFIRGRLRETETRSRGRSFEAVTLEEKRQEAAVEGGVEEGGKKGRKKRRGTGWKEENRGRLRVGAGVEGWKEQVEVGGGKSWNRGRWWIRHQGVGRMPRKSSLLLFPISLLSLMHRRPEVPLVLFGPVNGESNEFQACRLVSFPSTRLIFRSFFFHRFSGPRPWQCPLISQPLLTFSHRSTDRWLRSSFFFIIEIYKLRSLFTE